MPQSSGVCHILIIFVLLPALNSTLSIAPKTTCGVRIGLESKLFRNTTRKAVLREIQTYCYEKLLFGYSNDKMPYTKHINAPPRDIYYHKVDLLT